MKRVCGSGTTSRRQTLAACCRSVAVFDGLLACGTRRPAMAEASGWQRLG
jgi:hypothetical protein